MELFRIGPVLISLADALDLLLVIGVLYGILWWFRRIGLLEVALVGVGLVVVLRGLVLLGLPTLTLLVRYVLSGLGILTVLLLAPELRREVMHLRTLPLFRRLRGSTLARSEVEHAIEEITAALEALRRQQLGALIVIEGEDDLTPYLQTGDAVQMPVRAHILTSIFQKNSPLHDGAVVIRGDKIIAVRCTLPLSEQLDLPTTYGTRHRAALGITEQTDALVLVISEETGYLSLVERGRLARASIPVVQQKLLSFYLR